MSVENFDGNGLADQPSIIYGFETDDAGDVQIRELSRSGYGDPGPSPGDVIERDSTKSSVDTRLPALNLPGQDGLAQDDCGENIPAFACASDEGCGNPVYVGRTCSSPTCDRDWPAAVKSKVTTVAGKLEGLRRALYARYDGQKDIDFNHVVASLPSLLVDSDEPIKRALTILKTLLEEHWDIDGFVAIFHPYRIKQEYRADQYDHGGEPGQGEMTWSDILSKDDPSEYIVHKPHFHTFFPAIRKSFDYLTAESVYESSGWLFHRITKGEDSNVSVEDLDDLVHQLTYCFSHTGVQPVADRHELASRMKGDLHNCYVPDGVESKVLASFCDAAPKLLGVSFANLNEATCGAEVSAESDTESDDVDDDSVDDGNSSGPDRDHPLYDVWNPGGDEPLASSDGDPFEAGALDAPTGSSGDAEANTGATTRTAVPQDTAPCAAPERPTSDSPVEDRREQCGGALKPMHKAADRLEDEQWCRQAEYVSGLRTAVAEWERITGGDEDLPWVDDDDSSSAVVPRG